MAAKPPAKRLPQSCSTRLPVRLTRPAGPVWGSRLGRPGLIVEAAHFQDLHAEQLEPGQQPVQGGLIRQLTVDYGLYRLDRGDQVLEVKQGLRRQDAGDTYLVGRGIHPGPPVNSKWRCP